MIKNKKAGARWKMLLICTWIRNFLKKWQDKIEGFVNAVVGDTDEKHKFGRAMFFIGMNIKEIRKDMGIEEWNYLILMMKLKKQENKAKNP